jgi:two-component system cell cycle sensor histidine kinase/response regulator CckA
MFFGARGPRSSPSEVDHTALYLGNGWFIQSSGEGVTLLPFDGWYTHSFAWGRRPSAKRALAADTDRDRRDRACEADAGERGNECERHDDPPDDAIPELLNPTSEAAPNPRAGVRQPQRGTDADPTVASSRGLHLRFALATLGVIALAGGSLLWAVRHEEVRQAERGVSAHARYVAQAILRDELRPADFRAPAAGAARARLDWLFNARVLPGGGLRVKLYRPTDGLVTYSNVHSLIGTHADDAAEQREVLAGHTIRDVSQINHEGGTGRNVKALEVYVPVTLRDSSRPSGVFELYESYAPVAASIRSFFMPFTLLLLGALLGLWAALFPLVQRMVRALERTTSAHETTVLELEETSEQLRQSQKMDAIGRLAGGVAHDFNNLLLVINGYSDLLSQTMTDPKHQRFADEIRSAGDRAAALTSQLLAFSRRQVLQPQVLDLNGIVREMETMMRALVGGGVRVVVDLDPGLHTVEADPSQLGQVLLNLAVNARDAMAGAGSLRITTRNDEAAVVLEVSDTGVGMDAETQARIFEPFFTTKGIGEGTGLGLSTVYGIVTQSGGTIAVRSAAGAGATFALRFPACDGLPAVAADGRDVPAPGSERVLVVDDEPVVRDLLAQILRDLGYEVATAGSADEARDLGERFDVLLTDVVMPGMTGLELSGSIDARHVLYMSGYDQQALVGADASFLQKPFGRDELAQALRDLLDDGVLHRSAA